MNKLWLSCMLCLVGSSQSSFAMVRFLETLMESEFADSELLIVWLNGIRYMEYLTGSKVPYLGIRYSKVYALLDYAAEMGRKWQSNC